MSKIRRDSLLRYGEIDDEEQALIDDQELCDDEINLFSANPLGMRHRQSGNKFNSISSTNDNESHELNTRIGLSKTRDLISEPILEYAQYDIQPGDSLQNICLRYACPINQVKRINGLMNDQDFYGLRRIKLPLGKFGLLEEILKLTSEQNQIIGGEDGWTSPVMERNSLRTRPINSPGSALSVSMRHNPRFKPLLSPGFSSDKINESNNVPTVDQKRRIKYLNSSDCNSNTQHSKAQHNHSHSFSSLRDFTSEDININIEPEHQNDRLDFVVSRELSHQSFIKSDLHHDRQKNFDDLIAIEDNDVEKVFEDLDYHVERAKAVAETYNQRAAELVDRIDINETPLLENPKQPRVSKIPELFFCNENFGLNYKKLLIFIIVVCLIAPLVYINQTNIVITQL